MEKMPLQYGRMASVAQEYCALIDGRRESGWFMKLAKLLPRLHVAVIALSAPSREGRASFIYDDERRCELFMRLSDDLQADRRLVAAYQKMSVDPCQRQRFCERMADNLTDMYFDLGYGLELFPEDSQCASEIWQYSFYAHWGKHLLDAECWLRAIDSGSEPVPLPEWLWPYASGLSVNPV